eukprot:snap_masked-scaffold_1-processed-gene-14.14-mRNA-1 protein AED:0.02 eAED:0.02 QI:0/-1/0/1/-1/1/1/0/176
MTTTRKFSLEDIYDFNNINLDRMTETFNLGFYSHYLSKWPNLFLVQESLSGEPMAYLIAKVEGQGKNLHGHISAITVAPEYRRFGLAKNLMSYAENVSQVQYNSYFVDLFVRSSNQLAIGFYEKLGYVIYRRVLEYYSGIDAEDALDMRKSLARDKNKEAMIPLKEPVHADDLEFN